MSVEDAFTEWQAEQEKEWQENQKALREAGKVSSGEQEWPRMSVADDLTTQTESLARTNEDIYASAQREEEGRQAREAERRAEEARKKEAYEAALHSNEYAELIKRHGGADAATNVIGRRIYPEEAKAMDNFGRAVFTAVAPGVAFPIYAAGDTLRAWKENEGRGRDAQITAAGGALAGNLMAKGVPMIFDPMRPTIRYAGQVASGVLGDMAQESAQRMAEGRPAVKDSPDAWEMMAESLRKQMMDKATEELTHRVLNLRRW